MNRRLCAAVALALVLVTGCGGSDDQDDTATPSSTELTVPTTPAPTTSAPATTSTSTTTTLATTTTSVLPSTTLDPGVDPAVAALVLSGQGIGAAEFGSEPEEVISYISSF